MTIMPRPARAGPLERTGNLFVPRRMVIEPRPALGGPARRILCVDNERDTADSLAALLTLLGYDTRVGYDGPTGLSIALDFRPDACVLDIGLPGMDGYELAGRLRIEFGRGLLLVAVTGWTGAAIADRIVAAGFDRVFVKPADPVKLAGALTAGIALNRLLFPSLRKEQSVAH